MIIIFCPLYHNKYTVANIHFSFRYLIKCITYLLYVIRTYTHEITQDDKIIDSANEQFIANKLSSNNNCNT